jgi:proteasome accessory factor A
MNQSQPLSVQFGLETEIGITRQQPEGVDVVAESIALVRSATAPGVRMCWDYRCEDPHMDARGFRVKELLQDVDEADYAGTDAARPLSFIEIKSDLVLRNGARFYNDHAHPEYCTPECSTLLEILQQDYAGDALLMACVDGLNHATDNAVRLYKNNTDFRGHSYGCHENYLIPRRVSWDVLSQAIQAFFVTRQICCGAGKFGWEEEDRFLQPGFQVSQRSDFFSELQSVDTMQRRPLVNTRDEPHANQDHYRRFHVIIGDANLSLFSTYLKVGTTSLVLQAMVNGAPLGAFPRIAEPLRDLKRISRDATWRWECRLANGHVTTAVEVQRRYLEIVKDYVQPLTGEWLKLYEDWEEVLRDLERDPLSTADRLDWSAKYKLIQAFREAEGVGADDPWLRSLDLAYHLLDREEGLYFGLVEQGRLRTPFSLEEVKGYGLCPPPSTRASIRGRCIEKFGRHIVAAQWDHLVFQAPGCWFKLDLRDMFDPATIRETLAAVSAADSVRELALIPFAKPME